MKSFLAIVLACGCLAGAAAAAPATPSVKVRVADLDPSQPAQARLLQARLHKAALEVCGAHEGSLAEMKRAIVRSDCYRQALDGARAQLERAGGD